MSDGALHPERDEWLVQCAPGASTPAVLTTVSGGGHQPLNSPPSAGRGASWSPNGEYFTTHTTAGLILWRASDLGMVGVIEHDQVRQVSWSADSSQVITLDTKGRAWLWSTSEILKRGPPRLPQPERVP